MVRLNTEKQGATWVIRVCGQLGHDDVPAFEEACRAVIGPLCLDLTELLGLDDHGVEAIRTARVSGATLSGASPYIELRLSAEP